jgi:signal transduction histidine kinase
MGATSVRRSVAVGALVLIGALFAAAMATLGQPTEDPASISDLIWFFSFMAFPVVGFLIAWHRPDNAVGWIFLGVGVAQMSAGAAGSWADLAYNADPSSSVGAALDVVGNAGLAVAWVLATTYPLLLLPDGHPPSARWRWVVHATTAGLLLIVVAVVLQPGPTDEDRTVDNPFGVAAMGGAIDLLLAVLLIGFAVVSLLGLASIVVRWHRGTPDVRRRLAWLALAAVFIVVVLVIGAAVGPWVPDWVGAIDEAIVVAALPVATGLAVLRSRLFDVEAVLDQSLVYALLTGLVVLTYAASVALATSLVGADAGRGAALVAAAAIAVSLSPVKEWLQRRIGFLLYGDRSRPYAVLSGVAAQLERTTDDDLLATVTASIAASLRVPYVRVAVGETAEVPSDAVALPLVSHGVHEGFLLVGQRSGGRPFDEQELRLLNDLARQVAREKRTLRLAAALQESRGRIVRGREEERLRVRRDLHDGIGPTLAAASLQCDALRERWPIADPQAAMLLGQIKSEVSQCVLDVRRVIDGLRPPALDDLGLAGVVREHAASLTAAGLTVEVSCPGDLEVASAAVEVAAYRILTEAMTNVIRHAAASRCTVSIGYGEGWLHLQVSDNGVGLPDDRADGLGLASMRERAAELGGELAVESEGGLGARITARLPVPELVAS